MTKPSASTRQVLSGWELPLTEALRSGKYENGAWPTDEGVSLAQVVNAQLMDGQRKGVATMQGQKFTPGVVYKEGRSWLQVLTRGSVGARTGTVHMTVRNSAGEVSRAAVDAGTEYQVADEFPKRRPRRRTAEEA